MIVMQGKKSMSYRRCC